MNALRFSPRRFLSLLKKEAIEIFRDRSILFMGLALPLLMLFIYGYGVSMDMEAVPAAVVLKERTPAALLRATSQPTSSLPSAPCKAVRKPKRCLKNETLNLFSKFRTASNAP